MTARSGFVADFQKFLMQGNVVDLAVAVIIGGAFGKIIESLVTDLITPAILSPVMSALGVDNLAGLSFNGILYGKFLAAVINFVVIALSIFVLIRAFEKAKKRFQRQALAEEAATPDPALIVQERLADTLERLTTTLERR
jgi:large conductance mechanosensitive channel